MFKPIELRAVIDMPAATSQYEVDSDEPGIGGVLRGQAPSTYGHLLMLLVVSVTVVAVGPQAGAMVATALIPVLLLLSLSDTREGSPYSVLERARSGE